MSNADKTFLQHSLASFIEAQGGVARFWVALSGGLDSCVLLHALAQLALKVPVLVVHVNHQLSANADQWQARCEYLAKSYGFPFFAEKVTVSDDGRGVEMAARQARYAVFERHLQAGDMLLAAHHLDDQAETLLLRLLRGTGLRGLGAMAPVRALGRGRIGRPLLAVSRAQLHAYAQAEALQWVEDESNQSPDYDRNYLRLQVMPLLGKRWPEFGRRWAQTAELVRESEALLQDYVAEDLRAADRRDERLGESISLAYLSKLSSARRNAVLRHWVRHSGYQLPELAHLQQVEQFLHAEDDAQPAVAWANCELRRFAQRLYLIPRVAAPVDTDLPWQPPALVALPDGGMLRAREGPSGLRRADEYRVTFRRGGERCQPHGRNHSQTLKKLFQEYQLEPWLRDRIPLIYVGEELAAVGDLWICRDYYVEGEAAWELEWSFKPRAAS